MPRNRITTELRADGTQLRAEFAKSSKRVAGFRKEISSSTKALAGFAAGAIGIRAGVGIFSDLADKFDRVGKLSNRFNLPVEEVQKLSVAAELTGTNIEKLTAGLTKATVSGVEAGKGIVTYARAFSDLKIDVAEFNQADASEKIALLSRAFADAEDEAAAFTAAYRILGKAGSDLVPLLRENADGVQRLTGSLKALSAKDVAAIEAFNDEMTLLKANLQAELARAFAGSMAEVKEEIVALGRGLVKTTAFLVEHKETIKKLVTAYLAYKGVKIALSKINLASAFFKTSLAVAAETAAIQKNTVAVQTNGVARAKSGGGLGKAGAAGAALTTGIAGFGIGNTIGNLIGDSLGVGDGPSGIDADEEVAKLAKELLKVKKIVEETGDLSELQAQNENFRNEQLAKAAQLHKEIAAKRALARQELRKEVNEIAAGVLKTELGYKSETEQLEAQRKKLEEILEKTREVARANGFDAPKDLDSAGAVELAREAAGAGRLQVAKDLLVLAGQLQEKKGEILSLEEGIKEAAESQKAADAEKVAAGKAVTANQEAARNQYRQELAILKLRSAGREEEAVALEREIRLREEAARLAKETGVSEQKALLLVRQKEALRDRAERGGEGGLDSRFDADGNRKLARDGKRKKIVLIRRDSNGVRIDSRALEAQKAKKKLKPEIPVGKIDRLIELSESQLKTWGVLQASS